MTLEILVDVSYLAASVLFILGLRSLTKPEHARRGMNQAALGMLLAIVGTLLKHEIVRYDWIIAGLAVGAAIGYPLGMYVPMTAMPQRIAISHLFGALAATLVGVAEYQLSLHGVGDHSLTSARMAALGFEVLVRRAHRQRQLHGFRQAAGVGQRASDHLPRAKRAEFEPVRCDGRPADLADRRPDSERTALRDDRVSPSLSAAFWCCRSAAPTCRS